VPNTTFVKMGAALSALAIALPVAAAAADDAPPSSSAPPSSPGGMSYADPGGADAPSVFADGSTLAAPLGEMLGNVVRIHGTLAGTHPGDAIAIQRLDSRAGWVTAVATSVAADGTYDAAWRSDRAGRTTIRVVPDNQAATAAPASAPTRDVTVFRPAKVTWYGPGFFGRRTACGRKLTRALLGVAHRSLPCGTLVELYKDGRTLTVPVVDRGPFTAGTSYDLTQATAAALGVTTTTMVGTVRADPVPAPAPAPAAP
jgi:hypothetical protein